MLSVNKFTHLFKFVAIFIDVTQKEVMLLDMTPNFFFFPAGCAYIVLMQLKDVGIIVCFKDKHLQMSLIAGMLHFFCVQI